ncbi:agmatine/peptidylarginine deiminase [Nibricoccus sp. IMCC34717]|uniref:agmatine deiminase family protein n=1 Tax=Nibricoccus sp. IMCC34717 TaxID=3034021 RepID=UPI003850FAD0
MARARTPAAEGFRMPAEWEPQEAVWFSWPHKKSTWPGKFRPIPAVFAGIVAAASRYQQVRINASFEKHAAIWRLLNAAGADLARVTLFNHPTNDTWCRDHGPIFVRNDRTGEVAVTDWQYNTWGGKYPPYDLDNAIPGLIARALGERRFENPMVLEGGSIDVNGAGLLLTTEACLLNPNRNPHLNRKQIEGELRAMLGVKQVLWLGDGIAGDDTDGHIDDLSRFYKADGIVTVVEPNARDINHRVLCENRERLADLRTPEGRKFDIMELPMPRPCYQGDYRLPASHANFLILNGAVLVPVFRQPKRDGEALERLAHCFPGRDIVPVDCLDLVWGLGTLHCISQQQPA